MYNTIVRMVPDRGDAEDILQETFIKVFRKIDTFKGESTLGAWIKRIAINASLNYIRSNKNNLFQNIDDQFDLSDNSDIDTTPPVELSLIQNAIKKLPEGSRVVFNLFLIEGYQHKEIAKILDISESTSKSQYQRARRLLQVKLKETINYD